MPERISLDGIADPLGGNKDRAERTLARIIGRQLSRQERRILDVLGVAAVLDNLDNEFWNAERSAMTAALLVPLTEFVIDSANFVIDSSPIGVDIGTLNEQASSWAEQHAGRLITQVTDTTQSNVARAVARYLQTPDAEFRDLEKLIATQFTPARARMIAITEVTNSYGAGTELAQIELLKQGIPVVRRWHTMQDEKVCPICKPLNDTVEEFPRSGFRGGLMSEPAHPNCRCWTTNELVVEES